jgi:hypothetical protein
MYAIIIIQNYISDPTNYFSQLSKCHIICLCHRSFTHHITTLLDLPLSFPLQLLLARIRQTN